MFCPRDMQWFFSGSYTRVSMRVLSIATLAACIMDAGDAGAMFPQPPGKEARAEITKPVLSVELSPVEVLTVRARDGHETSVALRKPPGNGPFPALVHFPGGWENHPLGVLKKKLVEGENWNRFLAAGFVTVAATRRGSNADPFTSSIALDGIAVVEGVKALCEVDPESVVLLGNSGGGALALVLAGKIPLCAVAAEEPATIVLLDVISSRDEWRSERYQKERYTDPRSFMSSTGQRRFHEMVKKISAPLFIAHGQVHPICGLNEKILLPELKRTGKMFQVVDYPGQRHGFTRGIGSPAAVLKFFEDALGFYKQHLSVQPVPVDESFVERVAVSR